MIGTPWDRQQFGRLLGPIRVRLDWYPDQMANSASENVEAELTAYVGSEPAEEMLREAGIVPTQAGKQRWRELLSQPIPAEALAEGRRWRDEARAEPHGEAA
jgi:hypothetical protein